jgi:hypothetical protein
MTPEDPGMPFREVELGPLHEAASKVPDDGGCPVDHSHEVPALAALDRRGFTAEFVVEQEALRIAGSDRRVRPEDVRIRDDYRFEGTSDPDDMSVIYALEARDGTRGTLTDAYGSYADPAIGAAVDRMRVAPFARRWRWRRALVPAALCALTVAGAMVFARRRAA